MLSEEFDVKWYGRYSYEDTCRDGDKMAETWIAATEAFDYDWAWLQVDDCFELFRVLHQRHIARVARKAAQRLPGRLGHRALHIRAVGPVHPQDMKDRQVPLPEFCQYRLYFWYYGRGAGNFQRFFL